MAREPFRAGVDDPYKFQPPKTRDPFDDILKHIYKTQSFPDHYYKMRLAQYAQHIWEAVEKGYGSGLVIGDEHKALLNKNIWQFAAAKTYSELKHITQELADADGVMRTESDFRANANKVVQEYDRTLKTEKSTAFRSGQMAYKWQDAQATKDTFPLIEFDAVLDDHTTDLCRSLDKIVVPVGHYYLELYWPPNHFLCRLNVRKLARGKATPSDKLPYPVIPENFKQNLAAQGLALPVNGGYFKDIPESYLTNEQMRWVNPVYFIEENYGGSGVVRAHERMDRDKRNELLGLAIKIAKGNNSVDLTPEIHGYDRQARQLFYPEIPETNHSNPDMRINGLLAELKNPTTWGKRKLSNLLRHLNEQYAAIAIIDVNAINVDVKKIGDAIKGRFADGSYSNIKEVWIIVNDVIQKFLRP